MTCGIYKIENMINHHIYIGQSRNIEKRWNNHKRVKEEEKHAIHRAIDKYGIENFSFDIIEKCEPDKLNEREIYWISKYNSYERGYNETRGGQGFAATVKLTLSQVEEITNLLKTNQYTNLEIAKKFEVSENTICGINTGYNWKRQGIDYPIAKERVKPAQQNYCIDCGKLITSQAVRCVKCASIASRKVNRPNKEELKDFLIKNNGNFTKAS